MAHPRSADSSASNRRQGDGTGPRSAADEIRHLIISGQLGPGERLPPERTLADTLKVSRNSLREAIRELSALNILVARQGDGTYVSELKSEDLFGPLDFALRVDPKSLVHYYELRVILEPTVAAMAAVRLCDEEIAELTRLLATYEAEVRSGTPNAAVLIHTDEQIHERLIKSHGNPLIVAIVQSVGSVARRGRELTVMMVDAPEESLSELRALVHAIQARDPLRAQAAMTRHVARWEEEIRREQSL